MHIHRRQVDQSAEHGGDDCDDRTDVADVSEVVSPRSEPADVRPAADAEVEDPRVDRRRDRRCIARDDGEHLRLEHRIVERREYAEHHRQHDHRADGDGCRLPEKEHGGDPDQTPAQQGEAVPAVHTREHEARDDAAHPEQHECRRNEIRRERGDRMQERLDVAVHREIRRRKERRHDVDARQRRLTHERRQLTDTDPRPRRTLRQENGEIDERDSGDHGEQEERHAPPCGEPDHAAERKPDNRRDRAARHDHTECRRLMLARHEARRERRGDRPENRVRAGDDNTRPEQHLIARRYPRDHLPDTEERHHQEQQLLQLHAAGQQHQRQRQQRHHPRVDRDHLPRRRLRHGERLRDIDEQCDRHELRRVEDKGRNRDPKQHHVLARQHRHNTSLPICVFLV